LEELLRLANHRQFGVSSERIHEGQMLLFNEVEAEAVSATPEPTIETITHKRRKAKGHREAILADLPEEIIEYRIPENEQICSCCHGPLHEMSTDVLRELKIIPAQFKVVKHIRYVYSCRHCERGEVATQVITAPNAAAGHPGESGFAFCSGLHYEPEIRRGNAALSPGAAICSFERSVIPPDNG